MKKINNDPAGLIFYSSLYADWNINRRVISDADFENCLNSSLFPLATPSNVEIRSYVIWLLERKLALLIGKWR